MSTYLLNIFSLQMNTKIIYIFFFWKVVIWCCSISCIIATHVVLERTHWERGCHHLPQSCYWGQKVAVTLHSQLTLVRTYACHLLWDKERAHTEHLLLLNVTAYPSSHLVLVCLVIPSSLVFFSQPVTFSYFCFWSTFALANATEGVHSLWCIYWIPTY